MKAITYLDQNDFNKKHRALRRYFMKSYKYIIFKLIPTLQKEEKKDGRYEVEIPVDKLFKKVYGPMKVLFSVQNDVAILEDIEPSELLMKCFERNLPTYKGVPYYRNKDFEKIKIAEKLIWIMKKDMEKEF